jgi:hypothetical protein
MRQIEILVPNEDIFIRFHHIRVEKTLGIPPATSEMLRNLK